MLKLRVGGLKKIVDHFGSLTNVEHGFYSFSKVRHGRSKAALRYLTGTILRSANDEIGTSKENHESSAKTLRLVTLEIIKKRN